MEVRKGIKGRRACGTLQAVFGCFLFVIAIITAVNGLTNLPGFLGGAFLILTGICGIVSHTFELIIVYMITGVICALAFGGSIILCIIVMVNYNKYNYLTHIEQDDNVIRTAVILITLVMAMWFIFSVVGVCYSCVPLCAGPRQDDTLLVQPRSPAYPEFQFQRSNEPMATVGPPPDYTYSNTGFVHTTPTQLKNYDNRLVLGVGEAPPSYFAAISATQPL